MGKSLLVPFVLSSFVPNELNQYVCCLHIGRPSVPQKGICLTHPAPWVGRREQQPTAALLLALEHVGEQSKMSAWWVLGQEG